MLGERHQRRHARGRVGLDPDEVRAARAEARAAADDDNDDAGDEDGNEAPALEW